MRHVVFILVSVLFLVILVMVTSSALRKADTALKSRAEENTSDMKISSSAFEQNNPIPAKYTCSGANINPPLTFDGTPSNAESFALIMDDPDAPNGTFVHWVVYNINPSVMAVEEGKGVPGGITGKNSSDEDAYMGPCPPSGTHHYHFKLYALDTTFPDIGLTKSQLEQKMQGHILGQAELIGLFSK